MALLNFGKKRKEVNQDCNCKCRCSDPSEEAKTAQNCCLETTGAITSIKVLGAGCRSCHEQYENVQKAVKAMELSVETEYITDMEKVVSYGVMSTPAIVINGNVVSMGKVLKEKDVEVLLRRFNG